MSFTYRCPHCELAVTSSEPLPAAVLACPRCGRVLTDQPAPTLPPATSPQRLQACAHLADGNACPLCQNAGAGHIPEWSHCPDHAPAPADATEYALTRAALLRQLLGTDWLFCTGGIDQGPTSAHWWNPDQLAADQAGSAPAPAPIPGETPAEHVRNALQILTGVVDYDGALLPLAGGELFSLMAGVAQRLLWAHDSESCEPRAKYELGIALGLVSGVIAVHPADPQGSESNRRDAAQFLRFRANAALVHLNDPVAPDPAQLRSLGLIDAAGEPAVPAADQVDASAPAVPAADQVEGAP